MLRKEIDILLCGISQHYNYFLVFVINIMRVVVKTRILVEVQANGVQFFRDSP